MEKLLPRNRRMPIIGFVLHVGKGSITIMQEADCINSIHFDAEYQDVYNRCKKRYVVISNVIYDGNYKIEKQADIKVLKVNADTWWTFGVKDAVNVCPRLSYPQQHHPRWPFPSDSEGRQIFLMVMNARKVFEERTKYHQKNNYKGPAFSKLDNVILTKKLRIEQICSDRINAGNGNESTPTKSPAPPLVDQKEKYRSMKRQLSTTSKRKLKMLKQDEIIDLSVTSDEESETEELTDADLQFLDDSEIANEPRPMNLKLNKEQRREFDSQVFEMIGNLLNKEEYHFKSKILSASTFYKILETARPVRSSTDLMSLIAGLPTNSVNMEYERLEALCSDLINDEVVYSYHF